jgi:fatty-acid desaturase
MIIGLSIAIGLIWSQIISHFGASILLHRHYCHNQFKVPAWFETLGLAMLMIACIRTPIGWIASHRMHHTHSDSPKDPHAAKYVGWWKVLTTTWAIDRIPIRYARDLYRNPKLVFCHKHWLKILVMVNVISFIINPYFWIAFCVVPFIFAKVGFGLLNTVGHKDGPSNVPWLNIFIAGEGYHKEHHRNTKKVRLHIWDTGGWLAERLFK